IGTDQYIAKPLFEFGSGQDEVSMAKNCLNLEFEVIRCKEARWFLQNFRSAAEENNVGESPSPASGIVKEIFEAGIATPHPSQIVWLMEPLRNPSVTHYTGTMEHPVGRGQLAHTISAFVHYAFQWSEGNIIFADIQGLTNVMGILLFNLMTHTPQGDSGVGDHGERGIEKWCDQHDCNAFCKNVQLEVGDDNEDDD
ncbi:kinase-like domain-containing protein, partial [Mycena crocata]